MMLLEDLNNISPQQAHDRKLFGPVYHGTTSDKLQKISSHGFNIFVGHERSGDVAQGYQASDYYGGIPAPIHHLGFGVYFTTVKAIAKKFGEGNNIIGPYFVDAPRMEIINFGSPRTMMKWWLENGYDYKKSPETLFGTGQTNLSLIRQERLRATQNMTSFLKAKYDSIWFKGKGMYRLLDGDQVVIFEPSRIYRVSVDMAQPGEIGSKVISKVGIDPYGRGEIKIPMGTKGTIIDKKKPTEHQKWAEGSEWIYHIKWNKGGRMYDILDKWIEPYVRKSKIKESNDKEKPYYPITKEAELTAVNQIEKTWGQLIGKTLHKTLEERHTTDPGVNYFSDRLTYEFIAVDNKQPHRLFLSSARVGILFRVINLATSTIVLDWRFVDSKRGIKENKETKPYYEITKVDELKAVDFIQRKWREHIGKTLKKSGEIRHREESICFNDIIRYEAKDENGKVIDFYLQKDKSSMFYKAVKNKRFLTAWEEIPISGKGDKIDENIKEKPYYQISKREESEAVNWIQKEWFWLIGKTLSKRSEDRKEDAETYFFDFMSFKADVGIPGVTEHKQLFFHLEKTENGLHYMVLDEAEDKIIRKWSDIPITLDSIQENIKKDSAYYHINRIAEQQCVDYINKEWGDIIGRTLRKFREQRRQETNGSYGKHFFDTIQYIAADDGGKELIFTVASVFTGIIEMMVSTSKDAWYRANGGWDQIPNAVPEIIPEPLNEIAQDVKKPYYHINRVAEQQTIDFIQKKWHSILGKTLFKKEERRKEYDTTCFLDTIIYKAKDKDGHTVTIYVASNPGGTIEVAVAADAHTHYANIGWVPVPNVIPQTLNENKDNTPIYEGNFELTKVEEQEVINYISKLYNKQIGKTLKKTGERWTNEHHDVYIKKLVYKANFSGDSILIYIEKSPHGKISYFLVGNTTKIFGFYPPTVSENVGDDDDHGDALNKTGYWGAKGAGAIILAKNTGRILLPRRSDEVEQPHTWGVWGGAIDSNEDPSSAVKREIAEEVGYHGLDIELIPLYVYHDSKVGFQYHNFLVLVPQEFTPKLNWETEGYRWVAFGQWPSPLHFGLKALLQNDGDKIVSIIEKLKVVPLKKEKIDKAKYQAAIHVIRLTWEDMRKGGSYKDRFDFDNEFVHWMLNNEQLQNLTEKYGALFFPNTTEPGHEFQQYVEQILEMLEVKHNDRRIKKIDRSDPLFLLKEVVRGKTWESAKQAIRALSTSGGKYIPHKVGDDEAENVFNRLYRIALGETFWSEKEMSQYRPLSSYILTADSPESEIIFFRYYSDKGQFPADVKVYRGLNSPTQNIRPGDHVSFDKGFARGYEAGKYGAVISAVLPSKDLLVKRMDVGSSELVYWPAGHKIQEVKNVPTFKQFYNQWAFP